MSKITDTEKIPESTCPISLNWIEQHQRKYPVLMDTYKEGMYHNGTFCGGSNIYLNLITYKDKIVIPSMIQSYALYCYHAYLLNPVMDRMEAIISQELYWPRIIKSAQKEVRNCDTCQPTKRLNINMLNYQRKKPRKYHG